MSGAPRLIVGAGSLDRLSEVVAEYRPARVLVVGSAAAVERTAIMPRLPARSQVFSRFSPNPRLEDVLAGCEVAAAFRPDLVVGVGGGSSMDVAKLVRILPPGAAGRRAVCAGTVGLLRTAAPALVLVPTVSGSGSEVTRFATVYCDGRKFSVDHERARARAAVVDPDLAATCPGPVALSCAFDALAHAVESYWSLRSTPDSRALAAEALPELRRVIECGGGRWDSATRARVARAAICSGRAIDLTRTTAAHAFAYPTTMRFGVPHGLACVLHLVWLFDYVTAHVHDACIHPRGREFVEARLAELSALLGASCPEQCGKVLESLVVRALFAARLGAYGVVPADLPGMVDEALGSTRAANLPVRIDPSAAVTAMKERL